MLTKAHLVKATVFAEVMYGGLPFFKIQVNHFMAQDKPFGAILNFKTFLSFIKQTASDYITSS